MADHHAAALEEGLKKIENPHVAYLTKELLGMVKGDLGAQGKAKAVASSRLDTIVRIVLLMPSSMIADRVKLDIAEKAHAFAKQEKLDTEMTSVKHEDCKCGGYANGCVSSSGSTCYEWFDKGKYVGCTSS